MLKANKCESQVNKIEFLIYSESDSQTFKTGIGKTRHEERSFGNNT